MNLLANLDSVTINPTTKEVTVLFRWTEATQIQKTVPIYSNRLSPVEGRPVPSGQRHAFWTTRTEDCLEQRSLTVAEWKALRDAIISENTTHYIEDHREYNGTYVLRKSNNVGHGALTLQEMKRRVKESKK